MKASMIFYVKDRVEWRGTAMKGTVKQIIDPDIVIVKFDDGMTRPLPSNDLRRLPPQEAGVDG